MSIVLKYSVHKDGALPPAVSNWLVLTTAKSSGAFAWVVDCGVPTPDDDESSTFLCEKLLRILWFLASFFLFVGMGSRARGCGWGFCVTSCTVRSCTRWIFDDESQRYLKSKGEFVQALK